MSSNLVAQRLLKEQDDLILLIFEFVDFPTLIRIQRVCKYWKLIVYRAISGTLGKRMIMTTEELIRAIRKYCSDKLKYSDELARTYGWPIGKWNVSQVTNFSYVFQFQKAFNEDIGDWDMSRATKLSGMFFRARSFNRDLSKWNTSKVTDMRGMFYFATSFNEDITTWDTSKVTTMDGMFFGAKSFNQNISSWNTSNLQIRRQINDAMFVGATSFNEKHAPQI